MTCPELADECHPVAAEHVRRQPAQRKLCPRTDFANCSEKAAEPHLDSAPEFCLREPTQPFCLRRLLHPHQRRTPSRHRHRREGPHRAMELRGDAVVGTLMSKPSHHRCLRIAPRLDRDAGGVPCRGFAPIGGNSERRAEFRPFAKDDRCSALADPDRLHAGGGDHGDPRRRGDASRQGVDKGVVGNVEAKRFEPGFMGIEFHFGCPKQPAGVVDQSDRF